MNCTFCQSKMFCEDEGFFICESCPLDNMQVFDDQNVLYSYSFAIKRKDIYTINVSLKHQTLTIIRWRKSNDGNSEEEELYLQLNGNWQVSPQNAEALLNRLLNQKAFL